MDNIREMIAQIAKKTNANKSKIDTEILLDTLYYRLTIIRLGEEDNNAWWESSILSEVGRRNLEKFFPNTFSKQRYDIGRKIIIEKENREISEKKFYITLFNYGYEFEIEIFKPFIKEIVKSEDWNEVLDMIEKIKDKKFTTPWAREFYGIAKLHSNNIGNEKTIELGSMSGNFYNSKTKFEDAIKTFLSVYNLCTQGNVVTPYYRRGMAI